MYGLNFHYLSLAQSGLPETVINGWVLEWGGRGTERQQVYTAVLAGAGRITRSGEYNQVGDNTTFPMRCMMIIRCRRQLHK